MLSIRCLSAAREALLASLKITANLIRRALTSLTPRRLPFTPKQQRISDNQLVWVESNSPAAATHNGRQIILQNSSLTTAAVVEALVRSYLRKQQTSGCFSDNNNNNRCRCRDDSGMEMDLCQQDMRRKVAQQGDRSAWRYARDFKAAIDGRIENGSGFGNLQSTPRRQSSFSSGIQQCAANHQGQRDCAIDELNLQTEAARASSFSGTFERLKRTRAQDLEQQQRRRPGEQELEQQTSDARDGNGGGGKAFERGRPNHNNAAAVERQQQRAQRLVSHFSAAHSGIGNNINGASNNNNSGDNTSSIIANLIDAHSKQQEAQRRSDDGGGSSLMYFADYGPEEDDDDYGGSGNGDVGGFDGVDEGDNNQSEYGQRMRFSAGSARATEVDQRAGKRKQQARQRQQQKSSSNPDSLLLVSKNILNDLSEQIALNMNKVRELEEQVRVIPELQRRLDNVIQSDSTTSGLGSSIKDFPCSKRDSLVSTASSSSAMVAATRFDSTERRRQSYQSSSVNYNANNPSGASYRGGGGSASNISRYNQHNQNNASEDYILPKNNNHLHHHHHQQQNNMQHLFGGRNNYNSFGFTTSGVVANDGNNNNHLITNSREHHQLNKQCNQQLNQQHRHEQHVDVLHQQGNLDAICLNDNRTSGCGATASLTAIGAGTRLISSANIGSNHQQNNNPSDNQVVAGQASPTFRNHFNNFSPIHRPTSAIASHNQHSMSSNILTINSSSGHLAPVRPQLDCGCLSFKEHLRYNNSISREQRLSHARSQSISSANSIIPNPNQQRHTTTTATSQKSDASTMTDLLMDEILSKNDYTEIISSLHKSLNSNTLSSPNDTDDDQVESQTPTTNTSNNRTFQVRTASLSNSEDQTSSSLDDGNMESTSPSSTGRNSRDNSDSERSSNKGVVEEEAINQLQISSGAHTKGSDGDDEEYKEDEEEGDGEDASSSTSLSTNDRDGRDEPYSLGSSCQDPSDFEEYCAYGESLDRRTKDFMSQSTKIPNDLRFALIRLNDFIQQRQSLGDSNNNNNVDARQIMSNKLLLQAPSSLGCVEVIRKEWFVVSTKSDSQCPKVKLYLDYFESFTKQLLNIVVNLADNSGNTALHYAASHYRLDIINLILSTKVCDVNYKNRAGYTPTMLLALADLKLPQEQEVARRLFSIGDVNIRSRSSGQTALMLASINGCVSTCRLLLECGADPSLQDFDGSTALMCGSEAGNEEIVKCLLAHKLTDPSATDNDGLDAITIAMNNGHRQIGLILYAAKNVPRMRLSNNNFGNQNTKSGGNTYNMGASLRRSRGKSAINYARQADSLLNSRTSRLIK